MKPVKEVNEETGKILATAVSEIAILAIKPELAPFTAELDKLVGKLEGHADELCIQVRDEKKALEKVNNKLGEVVTVGQDQAKMMSQTLERLDSLNGELSSTRDANSTALVAINVLRDEILGWMKATREQAERLAIVLDQADMLTQALERQTIEFSRFGDVLSGQVDAKAKEVSEELGQVRADASREAVDVRSFISTRLDAQEASVQIVLTDVRHDLRQVRKDASIEAADVRGIIEGLQRSVKGDLVNLLSEVGQVQRDAYQEAADVRAFLATRIDAQEASAQTLMTEVLHDLCQVGKDASLEAADVRGIIEALGVSVNSNIVNNLGQLSDNASREAADVRVLIATGFEAQEATAKSHRTDLVTNLGSVTTELKVLLEELRSGIHNKLDTGIQGAADRLESGQQQTAEQVTVLRSSAETMLDNLKGELKSVFEQLSARNKEHGKDLTETGQTAVLVFRIAIANLVLVLIALTMGGAALWIASR